MSVTVKDAKEVTEVIVKELQPFSVLVFGSVAKNGSGEDLDLLIVMDEEKRTGSDANVLVHRCLKDFYKKFSIDPFVLTKSDFAQFNGKGSPFLRMILKEGRLLYMKDAIDKWFKQADLKIP